MNYNEFKEKASDGKLFSVTFKKKDGTMRKMVCRVGVKKHLRGGELGYNPEDFNYLTVYEFPNKGYKTINFNTLVKFIKGGFKWVSENS